ncbi:MAG: hypothetical protein ACM3O4_04530 [Ignavibacteriales bacterium]
MPDYKEMLNMYLTEEVKQNIGNVDTEMFYNDKVDILYYFFPLIEKLVLEILKIYNYTDIECYEQGKYRTLYAIIQKDQNRVVFPAEVIDGLEHYYKDDGLRNLMMHYSENLPDLKIKVSELIKAKNLFCYLLIIYKTALEQVENQSNTKIEYLTD